MLKHIDECLTRMRHSSQMSHLNDTLSNSLQLV